MQRPDRLHAELIVVRDALEVVRTADTVGRSAAIGAEFVVDGLRHGLAQHGVRVAAFQAAVGRAGTGGRRSRCLPGVWRSSAATIMLLLMLLILLLSCFVLLLLMLLLLLVLLLLLLMLLMRLP